MKKDNCIPDSLIWLPKFAATPVITFVQSTPWVLVKNWDSGNIQNQWATSPGGRVGRGEVSNVSLKGINLGLICRAMDKMVKESEVS